MVSQWGVFILGDKRAPKGGWLSRHPLDPRAWTGSEREAREKARYPDRNEGWFPRPYPETLDEYGKGPDPRGEEIFRDWEEERRSG